MAGALIGVEWELPRGGCGLAWESAKRLPGGPGRVAVME